MCPADYVWHKAFFSLTAAEVPEVSITIHLARYESSFSSLFNHHVNFNVSGFGGLEVACWPLIPKFAGSNTAEAVGFLRVNKNPQHVGGHGCLL